MQKWRKKMRKYYSRHIAYLLVYLIFLTVVKGLFDVSYLFLWFGGIVGILAADLDQFVYVYFLHPEDPVSIQVRSYISQNKFILAWKSLISTKGERKNLIFHTAHFYLFFLALTIFILTSTANFFGQGLTIGFTIHLLVDQYGDYKKSKSLDGWFEKLGIEVDPDKIGVYLFANVAIMLVVGLLF